MICLTAPEADRKNARREIILPKTQLFCHHAWVYQPASYLSAKSANQSINHRLPWPLHPPPLPPPPRPLVRRRAARTSHSRSCPHPPPLPYPFLHILSTSHRCTGEGDGSRPRGLPRRPRSRRPLRHATPRNASCSASSNTRRAPLRERVPQPPSSAHGRGRRAWRGGRGAGEGAAAIPGPITGVVAAVDVARVAALGRLLGCSDVTPSPPTPP